jgi:hypothetical protein
MVLCAVALSGCTRNFFRKSADREVVSIFKEKDKYDAWAIENWHVYPDSRARFADPTNPDRPPMPPDDPAARLLSPNPQKPWRGVRRVEGTGYLDLLAQWDAANRAEGTGQSLRMRPMELRVRGKAPEPTATQGQGFLLSMEQAVELGLFNSREYQDRREGLYLAALPVTLARFAFAPQFFTLGTAIREWTGAETPEGGHNRWRLDGQTGFTKQFVTGATLLLQLANQTVIEFGNTALRQTVSESVLLLDLMQPLLQGGGWAVTLEPLTQAERNLLYAIRSYAHFRKEFFVFITSGVSIGTAVFDLVDILGTGSVGSSVGFLPAIQRRFELEIDRQNVAHLEEIYRLFQGFAQGGDIAPLQVDQVEDQLLRGRSIVLLDEQNYANSVDQLKLQLGLPTDLPLEPDVSPLRPLHANLVGFVAVANDLKEVRDAAAELDRIDDAATLRQRLRELLTESKLVQSAPRFRERIGSRWDDWARARLSNEQLTNRLRLLRDERNALLDLQTDLEVRGEPFPPESRDRLRDIEFTLVLGEFERLLRLYEIHPWSLGAAPVGTAAGGNLLAAVATFLDRYTPERQRRLSSIFRSLLDQFDSILSEARNERIERLRQGWPALPPVCVNGVNLVSMEATDPAAEEQALAVVAQAALQNRFDLMNARAQVVDAWRQIAVSANSLLGVLNVGYQMESLSPVGLAQPLNFTAQRTRHRMIIHGELPLVRKAERNFYRRQLIAFQQARRALMEAEDRAVAEVRRDLRQLQVLAKNYKIQQRAVELAYSLVENSLETFRAPPGPTGQGGAVSAAALTQQLLGNLSRLPQSQNTLVGTWVNYLMARYQLYRDLELMPLDNRGVWIDEFAPRTIAADCAGLFDPVARPGEQRRADEERPQQLPPPRPVPPADGTD